MGLEVEFITLGEASIRLDVPSATLRNWTDQMEEYDVHYVMRNNRNERIYYEEDLEIFRFIKALKKEHGRKTTTKDISYILKEKGEEGEFILRTKEDAPHVSQEPSNRTAELLNQEDIKKLMESERVRQFMNLVFERYSKVIEVNVVKEVAKEIREEHQEIREDTKELKKEIQELKSLQEEANKLMKEYLESQKQAQLEAKEIEENKPEVKKGFWSNLFGGK